MKKFFSTKYSDTAFNFSMLVLRLGLGITMIPHGYDKLVHFASYKSKFINFIGLGSTVSLTLVIFAEFFCSTLLVLGLFTRFAGLCLVIAMSVALFKAHHGDIFGDGEHAGIFLAGFIVLLLVGPGKASMDKLIFK